MEETQKQYELTLILSPELKEENFASLDEEIKVNMEKLGGVIKRKGIPERRNLAYPIKNFQSGYYLAINLMLAPEKLNELYSILKHRQEILRYIIIVVPDEKPQPAPKKKIEAKIEKKEKTQEKTEEKVQMEEIDKKLEEILGA